MPQFNLSERERNLVLIAIGVVIAYFFYQFLLVPKWDEISRTGSKVNSSSIELKIAEARIKVLAQSKSKGKILAPQKEANREEKALEAFKQISYSTAASGLNLNMIKPIPETSTDKLRFSLSCTGKYRSLYSFLKILSKLKVLILVDSLDLNGGGTPAPDLGIQMTLSAYL